MDAIDTSKPNQELNIEIHLRVFGKVWPNAGEMLPDYSGRIGAAYAMEAEIERRGLTESYAAHLWEAVAGATWVHASDSRLFRLAHATPLQRCAAALQPCPPPALGEWPPETRNSKSPPAQSSALSPQHSRESVEREVLGLLERLADGVQAQCQAIARAMRGIDPAFGELVVTLQRVRLEMEACERELATYASAAATLESTQQGPPPAAEKAGRS